MALGHLALPQVPRSCSNGLLGWVAAGDEVPGNVAGSSVNQQRWGWVRVTRTAPLSASVPEKRCHRSARAWIHQVPPAACSMQSCFWPRSLAALSCANFHKKKKRPSQVSHEFSRSDLSGACWLWARAAMSLGCWPALQVEGDPSQMGLRTPLAGTCGSGAKYNSAGA